MRSTYEKDKIRGTVRSACTECRHFHTKCDDIRPCFACLVKRGTPERCHATSRRSSDRLPSTAPDGVNRIIDGREVSSSWNDNSLVEVYLPPVSQSATVPVNKPEAMEPAMVQRRIPNRSRKRLSASSRNCDGSYTPYSKRMSVDEKVLRANYTGGVHLPIFINSALSDAGAMGRSMSESGIAIPSTHSNMFMRISAGNIFSQSSEDALTRDALQNLAELSQHCSIKDNNEANNCKN